VRGQGDSQKTVTGLPKKTSFTKKETKKKIRTPTAAILLKGRASMGGQKGAKHFRSKAPAVKKSPRSQKKKKLNAPSQQNWVKKRGRGQERHPAKNNTTDVGKKIGFGWGGTLVRRNKPSKTKTVNDRKKTTHPGRRGAEETGYLLIQGTPPDGKT